MSLDKKSLTELRSIAQSIGIIPRYDVGKEQLLQDIAGHVSAKVQQPEKPIQVNITSGDKPVMQQHEITEALKGFVGLGLVISFPDERTWEMYCNGKRDSGTMFMSMWNVVQCAKEMVRQ